MTISFIEFGAPWCPACIGQEPITKEFCDKNGYDLTIVNVDTDNSITEQYTVTTLPTILLIDNGVLRHTFTGFTNSIKFKRVISEL